MVALTLPDEVVRGLRKIHEDLGWAIVSLLEKTTARTPGAPEPHRDAELVKIADRQSLIVVDHAVFKSLPGINIIPLHGDRAFLALDVGRGMADLELAVIDRQEAVPADGPERKALSRLRAQLRVWRHDRTLRFRSRAIIVVERERPSRTRRSGRTAS